MKQRRSNKAPAILLIAVGVVIAAFGIAAYKLPASMKRLPNVLQLAPLDNKDMGLVSYIPNFENLTIEDLPNFSDVRLVHAYNSRKIVMGYGLIVDVDDTGVVHRINAPELNCIFSAAVIGKSLYTNCNETEKMQFTPQGDIISSSVTVVRTNLDTGSIEERLDVNALTGVFHVNLKLDAKGNDLWGGSRAGVFRYNTVVKDVAFFPPSVIFPGEKTQCLDIGHTAIENDTPTVFSQNCNVVSTYDESTATWKTRQVTQDELPKRLNLRPVDFGLDLPAYGAISPIVNGKRYLFASDGLYTLKKNEFPKRMFESKDLVIYVQDNAYVDSKETYALAVSISFGGMSMTPPKIGDDLRVYLVSLTDGAVTELVDGYPRKHELASTYEQTIHGLGGEIKYIEEGDIVRVMDDTDEKTLLVIDVAKKTLDITAD